MAQEIELPSECNKDMVLGEVVGALNSLIESNKTDHDKIFKRLEEGDQYLFVLKLSSCAFGWLNRNGIVKGTLAMLAFFIVDWVSRYLYWDIFTKP